MPVKKCICEICICGRHRCPHRPYITVGTDKPCMLTEYANKYHPHPFELRESFKPPNKLMDTGIPMDDKTTHRVDYVRHPTEKPMFHQPDAYKKPTGEHDLLTSYTKDYPEKFVEPAKAVKHDGTRQVEGKFEGEPTYTADYRKWDLGKPKRYGPDDTWKPPGEKFDGQSTFQRDYRRYNELPRQAIKPANAGVGSDGPFDGRTGYRDDYIRHPMAPRFIREREKFKPNNVPLDDITTFKRDYRGQPGDKAASFKPDGKPYLSDAPFEDKTTFKTDYRPWAAERPHQHLPDVYKKPDGDMDMNTTNRLAYKQHPLMQHAAIRPAPGRVMDPGTFEGITNYRTDYKPWEIDRVYPTMKPGYQPNDAPFEGLSTQKAHYVPHPMHLTQSCKPSGGPYASDAPFDDGTIYRLEYTPKKTGPCPAAILDTTAAAYRFLEVDPRGHKVYQSLNGNGSLTNLAQMNGVPRAASAQRLQPVAAVA